MGLNTKKHKSAVSDRTPHYDEMKFCYTFKAKTHIFLLFLFKIYVGVVQSFSFKIFIINATTTRCY